MTHLIVGLGNPGEKYEKTRHNAGRMLVQALAEKWGAGAWQMEKGLEALSAEAKIGRERIRLLLPETMMNNSGRSLARLIKNKKQAALLIVAHDDLDLPLGKIKISFNRGSGGHRGLESVIRQIKTREFLRIRVGISPRKKPTGEKQVLAHILGSFKPSELKIVKNLSKKAASAAEMIVKEGKDKAMTLYN